MEFLTVRAFVFLGGLSQGKVVLEKYFNGMTPGTRHLLMSVSKSVTGTLAGILVNDGRLNPTLRVID